MAYVIKTKGAEEQPFFEALQKAGIELREKDLIEYASGHKKGDWDVGLTIDVVRMLDMLDVVVLISGDGDYIPLVHFAQARGRIVELMSFGETTSSNLVEEVDDRIDLSQNKHRYLIGPTPKLGRFMKKKSSLEPTEFEDLPDEKDEEEESPIGFFMDSGATEDQEDSRIRRLEF